MCCYRQEVTQVNVAAGWNLKANAQGLENPNPPLSLDTCGCSAGLAHGLRNSAQTGQGCASLQGEVPIFTSERLFLPSSLFLTVKMNSNCSSSGAEAS